MANVYGGMLGNKDKQNTRVIYVRGSDLTLQ